MAFKVMVINSTCVAKRVNQRCQDCAHAHELAVLVFVHEGILVKQVGWNHQFNGGSPLAYSGSAA